MERDEEPTQSNDPLDAALAAGFGRNPASPAREPEAASPPAHELRFGDYRIIREVGRGGMGIVYEAEQVSLRRRVALKVLPYQGLASDARIERFRREAQAIAALHHTNIVTVYGVGEHQGSPYFAMRFIDGAGVDRVIEELRAQKGLPVETEGRQKHGSPELLAAIARGLGSGRGFYRAVARLGVQLARALEYAHASGVLHRDVKPSNLIIDAQGTVWLADFGLAKSDATSGLTQSGDVLGTIHYMSPERFQGQSRPEGDTYSLGLTLYELLTLQPAFEPSSRERLVKQILEAEPPAPRRLAPHLPRDLETIVLKAISKSPADRYSSAGAFARDLEAFIEDRAIVARRASALEQTWKWCRRKPVVAGLLSAVALLILAMTAGSFVAATLYRRQRDAAEAAEGERTRELYQSYLTQAKATRLSGGVGLDFVRRARSLLDRGELSGARLLELRDEAIACLTVPALQVSTMHPFPPETSLAGFAFDAALERFVLIERDGSPVVRRVSDGEVIDRLPKADATSAWFATSALSAGDRYLETSFACTTAPQLRCAVWDFEARQLLFETGGTGQASLSPDGKLLAVGGADGTLATFELPGGKKRYLFATSLKQPNLWFDPTGKLLACLSEFGKEMGIFDVESRKEVASFHGWKPQLAVAWSPDGKWIATSGLDAEIHLWDFQGRTERATMRGHEAGVTGIVFHPDGDLILSSSWDGTTRLWDAFVGRERAKVAGASASFRGDGRRIGLVRDRSFGAVDVVDSLVLGRMSPRDEWKGTPWKHFPGVSELDFSPDGSLLASASDSGVYVWSVGTGRMLTHLPMDMVESATFDARGRWLWTYGEYGLFRWPIERVPDPDARIRIGPPAPFDLAPRHDWQRLTTDRGGKILAYVKTADSEVRCIDAENGRVLEKLRVPSRIYGATLSPDGRWLATIYWKCPWAKMMDLENRKATTVSIEGGESGDAIVSACFSLDGKWMVTGTRSGFVRWRVGTWEPMKIVPRDTNETSLSPVAFSPRGDLLAVTPNARLIDLVELETGRRLATLTPPEPQVITWLRFSPDGMLLAVASESRTIQLWDLARLRSELAGLGLEEGMPGERAAGRPVERDPIVELSGVDKVRELFIAHEVHEARAQLTNGVRALLVKGPPSAEEVKGGIEEWLDVYGRVRLSKPAEMKSFPREWRLAWVEARARLQKLMDRIEPGCGAPSAPVNRAPRESATVPGGNVALESSPYAVVDGKARHGWSRWQVREERGSFELNPTFDVLRLDDLEQCALPPGLLLPATDYLWRVAHVSADGQMSPWSVETRMRTEPEGLEPVRFDLTAAFDRDVVADPGDDENDEIDPGNGDKPIFLADGFDGTPLPNPSAHGLPADRKVGVYLLGDYGKPNSIQLGRSSTRSVRVPAPPGRYRALRFLLCAGWGDATLDVVLEHSNGFKEEREILCSNWVSDIPPGGERGIAGDTWPVLRGLDHIRAGKLSGGRTGIFFEVIVSVDPGPDLSAIVIDPGRSQFEQGLTRANVFAVVGMRAR